MNGKANIGMCSAGVCSSSSSSVTDHLMWVKCLYYHLYILQVVSTHFTFTHASILTLLQVREAFQNIFQVWKCDLDFRCDWMFQCLTAVTAWRLWQYDCHKRIMPGHLDCYLSASVSLKHTRTGSKFEVLIYIIEQNSRSLLNHKQFNRWKYA